MQNTIEIARSRLATKIERAINDPMKALTDIFETHGLGDVWRGEQPLFGGDDAAAPAGMFVRADDIVTIPGQRGVTLDGQPLAEIWVELNAMLSAFNQSAQQFRALLTFDTIRERVQVGVPTNPGFQKATELGRPSKIREKRVSRGFPLEHYDLAYGYTQEYIDSATRDQILAVQVTIQSEWTALEREVILDALFQDANFTDKDEILVRRLYNADGEVPPAVKRWTHDGTHTHYLVSGAANFSQANLTTMEDHLVHHGFREFEEAVFILHANRADINDATNGIRTFAGWIPAETSEHPEILANSGVVRGLERSPGGGLKVEGFVEGWTVVQNNDIPAGYLLGEVSGGAFDFRNPVGFRQHENPGARGLRLIEGEGGRYPIIDAVYDGYVGAGVAQRGAAVVMQATAGAYTAPTFSVGI